MKLKILLLVMLSAFCISKVHSQRYHNAKNIQASMGIVEHGFSATLGYEKNINWNHSYLLELGMFTEKEKVVNSDVKAKFTNFLLAAKYRYYMFAYGNVFPLIGVGGFAGYELYSNKKSVPDNVLMNRKDDFIYGFNADVGIEYNVKSNSLFITYSPMYELNQKDYIHHVRIGYKHIF